MKITALENDENEPESTKPVLFSQNLRFQNGSQVETKAQGMLQGLAHSISPTKV